MQKEDWMMKRKFLQELISLQTRRSSEKLIKSYMKLLWNEGQSKLISKDISCQINLKSLMVKRLRTKRWHCLQRDMLRIQPSWLSRTNGNRTRRNRQKDIWSWVKRNRSKKSSMNFCSIIRLTMCLLKCWKVTWMGNRKRIEKRKGRENRLHHLLLIQMIAR